MTNDPQPNNRPSNQGTGANPELDPGMRMILSMSPQDGSLKPLPDNLVIQEPAPGIIKVTFPDGSVRELIQGGEGAGHMVTTNPDGSRIQSDLTFADGQVSISSISSTGEKTLLSLNENGANIQRITADGQVSNFIPDNAPELIQGLREAETYSQAEDSRQAQFQEGNQDFGPWNNYGKPADWQPEQNWQPMGNDGFPRPEYAGNNWVDAGNGSWIAPIQPDAFNHPGGFNQPQDFGPWNNFGKPAEWQPDNNWQPPQNFGGGFNQPGGFNPPVAFNQPGYGMPAAFQPNVANAAAYTQQPQDFGPWNNFGKPAEWQPDNNWQPPQNFVGGFNQPGYGMPAAFQPNVANAAAYTQQPQDFGPWNNFGKPAEWQPDNNWQPPQNFGGGFNQPAAFMPPQNFTSGMLNALASVVPTQHFDRGFNQGYNQPGTSYGLDPQPEPPHTMAGGNWQQEQVANKVMQAVEIMTTDVARSLQMGEAREVQTGGVNFGVTAVNPVDLSATRMFDLQSHLSQPGVMMPQLGNWQPPQNFGGGFNPPATFMPPPMKDASGFPIAEPANDNATGTLFSALQPASAMPSAHILDGPVGDDSPDVTDGEPNTPQY